MFIMPFFVISLFTVAFSSLLAGDIYVCMVLVYTPIYVLPQIINYYCTSVVYEHGICTCIVFLKKLFSQAYFMIFHASYVS